MSDRALLEAAAKAAGIPVRFSDDGTCQHAEMQGNDSFRYWAPWNPLTDDGDALRLAIQLKIVWSFQGKFVVIEDGTSTIGEALGYDSAAAVRRAIVRKAAWITRAAASIGSGKESAS